MKSRFSVNFNWTSIWQKFHSRLNDRGIESGWMKARDKW